MDLDANSILASLLVSGVGFVAFMYGKKQSRAPQLVLGLALMIFPYFVSSAAWILVIGAAVCVAMWGAVKLGW